MNGNDRRRLVGVLGQLSSDQPGIRDAAACTAAAIVARLGMNWEQVIAAPPCDIDPAAAHGEGFRRLAVALLERSVLLDDAEASFLKSILGWRKCSKKQAEWLERIAARVAETEQLT